MGTAKKYLLGMTLGELKEVALECLLLQADRWQSGFIYST